MAPASDRLGMGTLRELQSYAETAHGFEIQSVTDGGSRAIKYTINDTMMRVDLPTPLAPRPSSTGCDACCVIGGDGTLLRASHEIGDGIPVLEIGRAHV